MSFCIFVLPKAGMYFAAKIGLPDGRKNDKLYKTTWKA